VIKAKAGIKEPPPPKPGKKLYPTVHPDHGQLSDGAGKLNHRNIAKGWKHHARRVAHVKDPEARKRYGEYMSNYHHHRLLAKQQNENYMSPTADRKSSMILDPVTGRKRKLNSAARRIKVGPKPDYLFGKKQLPTNKQIIQKPSIYVYQKEELQEGLRGKLGANQRESDRYKPGTIKHAMASARDALIPNNRAKGMAQKHRNALKLVQHGGYSAHEISKKSGIHYMQVLRHQHNLRQHERATIGNAQHYAAKGHDHHRATLYAYEQIHAQRDKNAANGVKRRTREKKKARAA